MKIEETGIEGLKVVRPQPAADDRGAFARLFCIDAFAAHGIDFRPRQISTSFNTHAYTLRGMHWQAPPHAEYKLVRSTRGAAFDVAVDLRSDSATRGRWFGLEISADNRLSLLIPPGMAHGFITLADATELAYVMDTPYAPAAGRGARFDDPAFSIAWPAAPAAISERDLSWPDWSW